MVRALDGYSERSLRDAAGDKSAGQNLAREADKLIREQHDGKSETGRTLSSNSRAGGEHERADQQRLEQQRKAEQKTDEGKPFEPNLLDGRKWQKDASGNFVTRAADGRLLTANADGKLVDYQSHVNQKHMQAQDQMALTSILFCNPLMLLGMGATFAFMDQAHGAKTAKMTDALNQKFDGKKANARAMQGSASELSHKAALIAQYTRPVEVRDVAQMNGTAGLASAAAEREELKKRKEMKKRASDSANAKRQETKVSMPADRYSMSAKKLMKTKRLLEDEIEKMRGKASLEEVSRLYAQVEVLDKALKRLANF